MSSLVTPEVAVFFYVDPYSSDSAQLHRITINRELLLQMPAAFQPDPTVPLEAYPRTVCQYLADLMIKAGEWPMAHTLHAVCATVTLLDLNGRLTEVETYPGLLASLTPEHRTPGINAEVNVRLLDDVDVAYFDKLLHPTAETAVPAGTTIH